MTLLLAVVCLLAGTAAAFAQVAGRRGAGALKLTATFAYIAFAVALGAPLSVYGRLVLVALVLSWFGDLFLIGRSPGHFLAGLANFLLAHTAYAAAFLVRGMSLAPTLAGAAVMAVVAVVVMRWLLRAGIPGEMRMPVTLYLVAIGAMVALAIGTAAARGTGAGAGLRGIPADAAIAVGAAAFAASDVFVARHRFVREAAVNRMVGLPLYFAAQLLIASSVAGAAP